MAKPSKKPTTKKATVASLSKRLDRIESMLKSGSRGDQSRSTPRPQMAQRSQMAQRPTQAPRPQSAPMGQRMPMPSPRGPGGMRNA
jgi:hypothetical protein